MNKNLIVKTLIFILLINLFGCAKTCISFNTKEENIFVGDEISFLYSSTSKINEEHVQIEVDNSNIIDDVNGTIKAIDEGVLKVDLLYKNQLYDSKEITIKPVLCESIKYDENLEIGIGRTIEIKPEYSPSNCSHFDFELISSDERICKIAGNKVTACSVGECDILIKSQDGPQFNIKCSISNVEPESIQIINLDSSYVVGETAKASIEYKPNDVTEKKVVWKTSDKSKMSINDIGEIVANDAGIVTIKAVYSDSIKADKEIEIKYPDVTAIEIYGDYSSVYIGNSIKLYVKYTPAKVDNDSITWTSENTKIATVDEKGVVKGISEGTVIIVAKTYNNLIAKKEITVKKETVQKSINGSSESSYTYILNSNTKKFHYSDCRSVKQMKESNKKYSNDSRDTIISKGYSPCKNCNP